MKTHNIKTALIFGGVTLSLVAIYMLIPKSNAPNVAQEFALPALPGSFAAPEQTFSGYPASMIPSLSNWPSPNIAVQMFDPNVTASFGITGGNQNYMPLFGMVGYSSTASVN